MFVYAINLDISTRVSKGTDSLLESFSSGHSGNDSFWRFGWFMFFSHGDVAFVSVFCRSDFVAKNRCLGKHLCGKV